MSLHYVFIVKPDWFEPKAVFYWMNIKDQGHVLGCSPGRIDERSHVLAGTAILVTQVGDI